MVIQRIQSVYLLLAGLLTAAVGLFVPLVSDSGGNCYTALNLGMLPLIVVCVITAVLQLVDIFLYTNLKLQMKVALMSAIMVCVSAFVWVSMMLFTLGDYTQALLDKVTTEYYYDAFWSLWTWPSICFVASFVLTLMARAGMKKDYKKLKSYDRLW